MLWLPESSKYPPSKNRLSLQARTGSVVRRTGNLSKKSLGVKLEEEVIQELDIWERYRGLAKWPPR
jgi:hypothetical protein